VVTLGIWALFLSAPGGSGDRIEWVYTFGFYVGLPLTIALGAFFHAIPSIPVAATFVIIAIGVVCNWALLGGILGLFIDWYRRKA